MELILLLEYIFVFAFGLCIGSFLNCLIYRMENKKSVAGRSFCPKCKKELAWFDLFPVLSFVFLQGKCRNCKQKISWQYPLVELATGIIFFLIFLMLLRGSPQASVAIQSMCTNPLGCLVAPLLAMTDWILAFARMTGAVADLAFWFYIAAVLIVIFVYDLKHFIIPDKILLPAIAVAFFYALVFDFANLGGRLLGAVVGFLFFFVIFAVSNGEWMGFGDVKFAVLMGLILGFSNTLAGLFFAFLFGAIIGIISMIFGKKGLKSEIPFGPFLVLGTFAALFWGQQAIDWYLSLLA
jgi:prepilin signal peptidase PulO-like enzyme (type II secretory pathway)